MTGYYDHLSPIVDNPVRRRKTKLPDDGFGFVFSSEPPWQNEERAKKLEKKRRDAKRRNAQRRAQRLAKQQTTQ